MKKIAFFLQNGTLKNVDCRNAWISNPGIGGAEYQIIAISYFLSKNKKFDLTLYAQKNYLLPQEIHVIETTDLNSALEHASNNNVEIFVINYSNDCSNFKIYTSIKLIIWCHNFVNSTKLNYYAKHNTYVKLIGVGREQIDMYLDHQAYLKSDYIYNGFNFDYYYSISNNLTPIEERKNIVTYIGSIVPSKGFHYLAKAWPQVLKEVPDAELYIIGSGKLYNRNEKLGYLNIAESKYEETFSQYITDTEGKLLPSIHVMGIMGAKKNDILRITKVGVPNPSGESETFGISAVEMLLMGCMVTTKKCCGYLDTVNCYGLLYSNTKSLPQHIIQLLKNPIQIEHKQLFNELKLKFDFNTIISEWERLLLDPFTQLHSLENNIPNLSFSKKSEKIMLKKIKQKYSLYKIIPSIYYLEQTFIGRNLIRITNYFK